MRLSEVGGCITVTTSITTATLPGDSQGTEQPLGYTAEAVECQAFLPKPGAWQQKEASSVEAGVVCSPPINVNNRNPHPVPCT